MHTPPPLPPPVQSMWDRAAQTLRDMAPLIPFAQRKLLARQICPETANAPPPPRPAPAPPPTTKGRTAPKT
jgi:hypothetical protein